MSRALDAGVNFWDTADVYGQDGLSERVIGKWFAANGHRDDVVLATKCRFGMGPGPNDRGASRLHIKRAVEGSLQAPGDRSDRPLPDPHAGRRRRPRRRWCARSTSWCARARSTTSAPRTTPPIAWSRACGPRIAPAQTRFVTLQAQYSLVERSLEREHVPALRRFGLGLLPWSPLGGGFLSGKYRREQAPPEGSRFAKWKDRFDKRATERNWTVLDGCLRHRETTRRVPVAGGARLAAPAADGHLGDPGRALPGPARGRTRSGGAFAVQRARFSPG